MPERTEFQMALFIAISITSLVTVSLAFAQPPNRSGGPATAQNNGQPQLVAPHAPPPPPGARPPGPRIPNEQMVLAIPSLTSKQKSQIHALYESMRSASKPVREQLHARGLAIMKYRSEADALSAQLEAKQGQKADPNTIALTQKKLNALRAASAGYGHQAHQLIQLDEARQSQTWTKICSILNADQLKQFNQQTRNAYVPAATSRPAPPAAPAKSSRSK